MALFPCPPASRHCATDRPQSPLGLARALFAAAALALATPISAQPGAASGSASGERLSTSSWHDRATQAIAAVTAHALSLVGVRYKFGSDDPERGGLDCSGLIRYVFQQATGIELPRSAREQARIGQAVALEELQPGDLVFFNTRRFQFSHVGLYLGNNQFIHAPSRGKVVEVVRLDQRYWQRAFNGARRIIDAVPALATATLAGTAHAAQSPTAEPGEPQPASPRQQQPVEPLPAGVNRRR
ncbi:MAG: C40 family peptidase [Burkholderiales bacterium]|nr:C40 family peptidase [Burkholderiales bacterium]